MDKMRSPASPDVDNSSSSSSWSEDGPEPVNQAPKYTNSFASELYHLDNLSRDLAQAQESVNTILADINRKSNQKDARINELETDLVETKFENEALYRENRALKGKLQELEAEKKRLSEIIEEIQGAIGKRMKIEN